MCLVALVSVATGALSFDERRKRIGDLGGSLESLGGVLGHHTADDLRHFTGHLGAVAVDRLRFELGVAFQLLHGGSFLEWRTSCEQVVEGGSEAVDI